MQSKCFWVENNYFIIHLLQIELMQNLADIVMGTVQYNEEGVLMSINELCGVMTNKSKAYEEEMEAYNRLVKLAKVWKSQTVHCSL